MAASIGYRRIENRPLALTLEQAAALKDHPEYWHYERKLVTLVRGTPEWTKCKRELRAALERLRYAATKKALGKEWTKKFSIEQV